MQSTPSQFAPVFPHALPQMPRVRKNTTGVLAFFAICGLCMLNVNYFTRAFLGTEQVFSVLYLLACLVLLYTFKFKIGQAIGAPGRLWLFAIILFLAVSTRMGMGIDPSYFMSPQSNFYRIIVAQLITVSAALGARHLVLIGRLQPTLRILFGFTVLAALTIVLTKKAPWILQYVGQGTQDRSAGFFADPNRAGQAVCMAASFGFGCLAGEVSKLKVFVYAGLIALIPCLFMTYSRSAIVFMACLVLLQFVISPILKRKETLVAILVVAIALPIGVNFVLSKRGSIADARAKANVEAQQRRMESLFNIMKGNFDSSNTGHRFVLFAVGLKYFVENPVIGSGFRTLVMMPEVQMGCHNTFLRIFGEAGLFAGLTFVGAIAFIAWSGWRCKTAQVKCLVIGFIAMYSCACMVGHTLLTNRLGNVSLGICLGFLSGTLALQKQQARQKIAATLAARQRFQQQAAPLPPAKNASSV